MAKRASKKDGGGKRANQEKQLRSRIARIKKSIRESKAEGPALRDLRKRLKRAQRKLSRTQVEAARMAGPEAPGGTPAVAAPGEPSGEE